MSIESQCGVKDEVTPGTPVTVDRFFEFNSEGIIPERGVVESAGLRAGQFIDRSDRRVPYVKGYAGPLTLEVLTAGFGWWLDKLCGAVETTGPADTTAYTHSGTMADLYGTAFTLQLNKPFHPSGTDQAHTYGGGKVTSWELSCSKETALMLAVQLAFMNGTTDTAMATASYPTGAELLTFAGAALTVAGTALEVSGWKIACDLGLNLDDVKLAADPSRREPTHNKRPQITWELTADHESLTQYNRVVSATAAGAQAAIIATTTGPTLISGAASTYPSLVATLPKAMFDEGAPVVAGPTPQTVTYKGKALDVGLEPLTLAYICGDATP